MKKKKVIPPTASYRIVEHKDNSVPTIVGGIALLILFGLGIALGRATSDVFRATNFFIGDCVVFTENDAYSKACPNIRVITDKQGDLYITDAYSDLPGTKELCQSQFASKTLQLFGYPGDCEDKVR